VRAEAAIRTLNFAGIRSSVVLDERCLLYGSCAASVSAARERLLSVRDRPNVGPQACGELALLLSGWDMSAASRW
jgi:hypothetical protein